VILDGGVAVCLLLSAHRAVTFAISRSLVQCVNGRRWTTSADVGQRPPLTAYVVQRRPIMPTFVTPVGIILINAACAWIKMVWRLFPQNLVGQGRKDEASRSFSVVVVSAFSFL